MYSVHMEQFHVHQYKSNEFNTIVNDLNIPLVSGAQKLLGDEPMFQDLSKGVFGDIPDAKTGKWQVPKIEKFSYALDQLVSRSGKQTQNMFLPEDRPLSQEERNLVETEGLCIGCHQYYGTPEWDKIVEKYGRAETAEQHEKMVSEAIKGLMEKNE